MNVPGDGDRLVVVWTAVVRRGPSLDRSWEPVGTEGSYAHARNERDDWRRDEPELTVALAYRLVPPWAVVEDDEAAGLIDRAHRRLA